MPKKFKGVNSKAEEAKARKDAVKEAARDKKQREEEDRYWQDDDKHAARKQTRKEEKDKRKADQLERKAAARQALVDEESQLKVKVSTAPAKTTRAQIQTAKEREEAAARKSQKEKTVQEQKLEENPNQAMAALLAAEGAVEARSVEDAIATLNVQDNTIDMHPEKRMKAAYAEFEERELPRLQRENPTLRLSQLKQMLRKDWMKSPENPLNQRY